MRFSDAEFDEAKIVHPEVRQEARELLEYGENRDGYWTSDKFMTHVANAVTIAECIYPKDKYTLCFQFDNAPTHTKMPTDALNASAMNVNPGGKQSRMHDTTFVHQTTGLQVMQCMQNSKGVPKGLKHVLCERGVDLSSMKKDAMMAELASHEDFKNEPCILEKCITDKGHSMKFIPKFHVEFSPIEPVWSYGKAYTRARCSYSSVSLRKHIRPGLDTVSLELIRKYFRKCREYMRAYREGHTAGKSVELARKMYKTHRSTPISHQQ